MVHRIEHTRRRPTPLRQTAFLFAGRVTTVAGVRV
jgi:hypothetical protein